MPHLCVLCRSVKLSSEDQWICPACAEKLVEPAVPCCRLCGASADTVLEICSECLEKRHAWQRGVTVWKYEGLVREAIHRYKYRGDLALAGFFAEKMVYKLNRDYDGPIDIITAIPLHPLKKFTRGYNQSMLLAKRLSALTNHPCKKLLDRVKCTRQQAMLDYESRQKNMKNAFRINRRNSSLVKDANIVLLDDVLTTGSTLNEAARVLIANGASSVTILSIARG